MAIQRIQKTEQYLLTGRVIDRATRGAVKGVRVEAWDRDTRYHDMLGVSITNLDGAFSIGFDSNYFGDYAPDRAPDVFFKLFLDDREVSSTFDNTLYNLPPGETKQTLTIDLGSAPPAGTDRVNSDQMLKMLHFVQDSDFRGVWQEQRDKAGTFGGFVGAIGVSAVKNFDFKPLRPSSVRNNALVGQDVPTARDNLAANQIEVAEVRPYTPAADTASLQAIGQFPLRLAPQDKVILYEDGGTVRYYTIVKPVAATSVDAAKVAQLDGDVQNIKAQLGDVNQFKTDLTAVKAEASQNAAQLNQDTAQVKAQTDQVASLKVELTKVQQASAQKDVQIRALQTQFDTLKAAHDDLVARVSPEKINQLQAQIERLAAARAAPAPVRSPAKTPAKTPARTPAKSTAATRAGTRKPAKGRGKGG